MVFDRIREWLRRNPKPSSSDEIPEWMLEEYRKAIKDAEAYCDSHPIDWDAVEEISARLDAEESQVNGDQ
jgi:hypothetical protein